MSSDNYAYDYYNWEYEVKFAENIANQTIMYSIQYGIKSIMAQNKKLSLYSQDYPDSESNASMTTCDLDEFHEKKSAFNCCFYLFLKKKYQYKL